MPWSSVAGSGIGRAVVDAFRDEGAKVAVLERDADKCDALRHDFKKVPVVEGDATTGAANDLAVATAVETFGGLDTLVNCVGIFDFYRGISDIDAEGPARRVRRDVPHQRAQPAAIGQTRRNC